MLEMPTMMRFCPACRTPFEDETDFVAANRLFKNNIDLFVVKCNHHKHGCTTQNNQRAMLDHEKDCDYNPVLLRARYERLYELYKYFG
jgi:hypothetical protein